MNAIFLKLLHMSISASVLIAAAIILRLLLKRAPKWISCVLWALVAVRLVCPFSFQSNLSLIPEKVGRGDIIHEWAEEHEYSPYTYVDTSQYPGTQIGTVQLPGNTSDMGQVYIQSEPVPTTSIVDILAVAWVAGMAVLLLYALVSYLRIRSRVKTALPVERNVWRSDRIDSPFIFGFFRPRIYLPFHMPPDQQEYVLAHERAHLKRRDHWWKPLGFILLAVYWFNPLVWVAYILLCRDIELACDEKVIKEMAPGGKKAYSEALLACSMPRHMIAACPLAFGEVGVKARIKSVLNYKKPAFWIIVVALIACIAAAVCFLTDPLTPTVYDVLYQDGYGITRMTTDQHVTVRIPVDVLGETAWTDDGQSFAPSDVVLNRAGDSTLYLEQVRTLTQGNYCDDYLFFILNLSHDISDSGTLRATSTPNTKNGASNSATLGMSLLSKEVSDATESYADAGYFRSQGPGEQICIGVKRNVVKSAQEYICFTLAGFTDVTYEKGPARRENNIVITSGASASASTVYKVTQLVYDAPQYSLVMIPENAPKYALSEDFTRLSVYRDETGWASLGATSEITLTEESFDRYFSNNGANGFWDNTSAAQIRSNNESAWRVIAKDDPNNVFYYILRQKNGDMYLSYGYYDGESETDPTSDDSSIRWLFRLAADTIELQGKKTYRFYDSPDPLPPALSLSEDGRFVFTYSVYSSYFCTGSYTLDDAELRLKTDDGKYLYVFLVKDNTFIFDAKRSSDIPKYNYSSKGPVLRPVYDGAVFVEESAADSSQHDPLNAAIRTAVLAHNTPTDPDGLYHCESHAILGLETYSGTPLQGETNHMVKTVVYAMVLHQAYSFSGGTFHEANGSHIPTVLTFDIKETGSYILQEYWEPRNGSYYEADIREKFPDKIEADARDTQKYILAQKQDCYDQAIRYGGVDTESAIESLFETMGSSPAWSSNPGDYIKAHPLEYRELTYYGNYTLRYVYSRFLKGGETGLRGHLMRAVMEDLLGGEAIKYAAMTGQDYFDHLLHSAKSAAYQNGEAFVKENMPKTWLLLELAGYWDNPAPVGGTGIEIRNLSDDEIALINRTFTSSLSSIPIFQSDPAPWSCFFSTYYNTVEHMDLAQFMAYFPGGNDVTDAEEFEALKNSEFWPFGQDVTLQSMPVPIHKYTRAEIDAVLSQYAGITVKDLVNSGSASSLIYLPQYDAYYNYTSDAGGGFFTCTHGTREGNIVRLFGESSSGATVLTLRKAGDAYRIVSFQR